MFFKILFSILAGLFSVFAAGHGLSAIQEPSALNATAAAGFGAGAGFFGWLAGLGPILKGFWEKLIAKVNPTVDPNNPTVPVNPGIGTIFEDAITAIFALLANPKDWTTQRKFLIELLKLAFLVGQVVVKDPRLDAILSEALELINKNFEARAPRALDGVILEPGKKTFAEMIA